MTHLETLNREIRIYLIDARPSSLAGLARRLRDETHPTGWAKSTLYTWLRGLQPSKPLAAALAELSPELDRLICRFCGAAWCEGRHCEECGTRDDLEELCGGIFLCAPCRVHRSNGDE